MRRPCFHRWIRLQVLSLAGTRTFNLRKLAAQAQRDSSDELSAALFLYAHENDCLDRLLTYVYDPVLQDEFREVEGHLGRRSIGRLALRGTPMRSLPKRYCVFLGEFERAYHAPERVAAEKRELMGLVRAYLLESGASPTELARAHDVDPANLAAYLYRNETHRITLAKARQLAAACAS